MGKPVDLIIGIMAAVATALLIGLIARDNIGMPPDIVREDALIAASVMIVAVAGMSSRKRDGASSRHDKVRLGPESFGWALAQSARNGW